MGKNKPQAYQLFVRDEYNKMKRAGQEVIYNSLFQALNSKWQSLPEERRLWYKERAANGGQTNGFQKTQPSAQNNSTTQPPPTNTPQAEPERPKPSTSNFNFNESNECPWSSNNIKSDIEAKFNADVKFNVDAGTTIKEERGVKRELELDNYVDPQQHQQHEQPNKKKKNIQGFGVPNWKNIKNSTQPDAERYFDYHLLKLRERCETIVSTHSRDLLYFPLHTISCNVLCKYKKDGKEVKYVPLEISITTYSIKNGQMQAPYHVIIDSGPPPRNYWGDTSDHMNAHKIKVTQTGEYPPEARNDYRAIYKEMSKYVSGGERTVLVGDNYDLEQVRMSIEWLYEKATEQKQSQKPSSLAKPTSWTILPLVDFVAAAYNWVYNHMLHYPLPKFTLHYYLKVRLETSIWDYDVNLMCPYHKKDEHQTKWCARSCAVRVLNALSLTFDEILSNYQQGQAAKLKEQQAEVEAQAQAQARAQAEAQAKAKQTGPQPTNCPSYERLQQKQQPMHLPEEKEPPPIYEEMARIAEIRRQQREAFQRPPPPPGDFGYNAPPPQENASNQPLAIEPAPHMLNNLDPRIRRQTNA
jgi:hypothetical protein